MRLYAEYIAFTPFLTATADTTRDTATAGAEATSGTDSKEEVLDELVLRQKELALRLLEWEWRKNKKLRRQRELKEFD